ncbi:MAG TPA: glycogen synthase [Cellulomonas sp.]
MRVDLLTREYPPHVYGGAGVHVAELAAVLRRTLDVRVHCFDGPRTEPGVAGYDVPADLAGANPALATFGVDLAMVDGIGRQSVDDVAGGDAGPRTGLRTDLVHSHTWYANLAGHLAALLHGVPHVVSAHSLEPLRPWKAEQLGGGYALSSWAEKTAFEAADAVIAVSAGMRADILRCYPAIDPARVHVVHNGIDLTGWRRPTGPDEQDAARALAVANGVDPDRPAVVFVGRITRQKGLPYLLRAAEALPPQVQLVLCAGAPDTPEIMAEVTDLVHRLRERRDGVVWIDRMLPRAELVAVLSACTVFACPSVYEPLGIVNLEAMAVGLPVVGTATGGIPEVVDDGVTGWLVPIEQVQDGTGTPVDPDRFVADLGAALAEAVADPARAAARGRAARRRVEEHFSWDAIGERTVQVYRGVLDGPRA